MKRICMVVPNRMVKGGIAAVVNGYRGSQLEKDYEITYVESYKDGNKFDKLLKGICGYFHFACVLLFHKPDLVHIHSSFGPSFYRKMPFIYMAFLRNVPIINHIHGADFDEFFVSASEKKKKKIKKVYNKCDVLIALSDEWKEQLRQIVPKEKIVIIENYSVLHEDALEERMKRACNNTTVPGWIRGDIKDKRLREADVFFLPSYNEGMPMSVLDAMGYGLPVVSTNVGGIPKIVHDGENGYCCEPGDIIQFSNKISQLLTNNNDRNVAAKESMHIIESGYSFEIHRKRLEELYNRIEHK